MRPAALLRLALAGTRTDALRVVLTALSAALAALAVYAALNVLAIPEPGPRADAGVSLNNQYNKQILQEPGLRPGVVAALLMLTIPVLALAGQCARLGAPARDRRLAAIRLAGATPRQAVAVAAAETGVASLLGSSAALAVYLAAHEVLHLPDAQGRLPLPTDVLPPVPALAAAVLGLPLLAALVAAAMLRHVVVSPFGVVRQARRERAPRPWSGILLMLGTGAFLATGAGLRADVLPDEAVPLLLFASGLLAALGVVLGAGWISHTTGRVLHRLARRPAPLLAARRLLADPWHGSRTQAALLVCVVFGAGAAALRAYFVAVDRARAEVWRRDAGAAGEAEPGEYEGDPFYLRTMDLVDAAVAVALVIAAAGLLVAVAEAVVARRRTHAALTAAGVPRSVLGRAVAWQTLAPLVPAVLLATAVGAVLGRGLFGTEVTEGAGGRWVCEAADPGVCDDLASFEEHGRFVEVPGVTRAVPVPLDHLALQGAGVLALVLAATGLALLFLRSATAVEELRTG
ncbi:hypothetical protein CUT44_05605 [Streptomyces carminius]|uniref:ABC transporter permease n=1 Tax=Streptomyces carminius TaxID=2665496 RepID=A0A2M8M4X8_9ACTN|nr:hypothetical protein [Streptomyces carminius]PJE99240.1 hypothetical protein CUT44_05605 [Streptomyces carminius]